LLRSDIVYISLKRLKYHYIIQKQLSDTNFWIDPSYLVNSYFPMDHFLRFYNNYGPFAIAPPTTKDRPLYIVSSPRRVAIFSNFESGGPLALLGDVFSPSTQVCSFRQSLVLKRRHIHMIPVFLCTPPLSQLENLTTLGERGGGL